LLSLEIFKRLMLLHRRCVGLSLPGRADFAEPFTAR
jgi:hypothetical protein